MHGVPTNAMVSHADTVFDWFCRGINFNGLRVCDMCFMWATNKANYLFPFLGVPKYPRDVSGVCFKCLQDSVICLLMAFRQVQWRFDGITEISRRFQGI